MYAAQAILPAKTVYLLDPVADAVVIHCIHGRPSCGVGIYQQRYPAGCQDPDLALRDQHHVISGDPPHQSPRPHQPAVPDHLDHDRGSRVEAVDNKFVEESHGQDQLDV